VKLDITIAMTAYRRDQWPLKMAMEVGQGWGRGAKVLYCF